MAGATHFADLQSEAALLGARQLVDGQILKGEEPDLSGLRTKMDEAGASVEKL